MKTPRTTIRELRRHLKAHLDSGKTIAIGDYYELRGFLVSVPKHERYNAATRKKALTTAKRSMRAAANAEAE